MHLPGHRFSEAVANVWSSSETCASHFANDITLVHTLAAPTNIFDMCRYCVA
jgi:hypothetical protein